MCEINEEHLPFDDVKGESKERFMKKAKLLLEKETLTYEEMINGVNNGLFDDVHFSLKSYSHYHSCHLRRKYQYLEIINKKVFECIELRLCEDESEVSYYHGPFKDKEKVFHIKGKGRFTLKEVFKDIEIISIKYTEKDN